MTAAGFNVAIHFSIYFYGMTPSVCYRNIWHVQITLTSLAERGRVMATDVQRVKKPKLPKKRFLKKTMNRRKR